MNLKQKILKTDTIKKTPHLVDEWGVNVLIRQWTGTERSMFLSYWSTKADDSQFYSKLLISCCEFEDGSKFEDKDADEINSQNGELLQKLADKILEVQKIGKAAVEEAKKN